MICKPMQTANFSFPFTFRYNALIQHCIPTSSLGTNFWGLPFWILSTGKLSLTCIYWSCVKFVLSKKLNYGLLFDVSHKHPKYINVYVIFHYYSFTKMHLKMVCFIYCQKGHKEKHINPNLHIGDSIL